MPWCYECEREFEENYVRCPICGAEMYVDMPPWLLKPAQVEKGDYKFGEAARNWPLDEKGEPVKPVLVTTVMGLSGLDYEMAAGYLSSFGIPTLRDFPGAGQLSNILFGFAGTGMDIYVPETMADEAKSILENREK